MSSEPAPNQTTADNTTNNASMANNTNPTSNNISTSDNSTKSTTSHTSSSSSTSTTTRHQNQPSSQPHHYAFRSGVAFEPHPQKREKGGEDAYFLHDQALGVFDGVGGWSNVGVDAGLYSKELARLTSQHLERTGPGGVVEALKVATVLNRSVGSSTACVVGLDGDRLVGVNLGDSGLIVIRGNEIVYRTSEQQHYFNCPFQIGTDSLDTVDVGAPVDFVLKPGDCVVMGTDGLWDNVFKYDIVDIVMEHDIASDFVQHNEQSSNKCTTTMTTSTTNPSNGVKVNPAAIDRTSTSSSDEEEDAGTLDPMVKCNDHKPECNDSDENEKTDSELGPSGESTGADGDTDTETDEPSSSSSSSSSLSSSTSSRSTIASPRQQESDEACCSDDDQAMSMSVNGAAGTGSDQDGVSSVLSDCEAEEDVLNTAVVRKAQRIADILAQTAIKVANDERVLSPFAVNAREAGHLFLGGKVDDITIVVAIVCPYSMDYTLGSKQNGRAVGMMDVDGHDGNSANDGMKSGANNSSKKTKIIALSTTDSEDPANMNMCGSSPSPLALPTSDDSSDEDDDSDDDDITQQSDDDNDDANESDKNEEGVDASSGSVEVIHAVKNSGKGTPRDKSPRSILDQGDASVLTGDNGVDDDGRVTESSDNSCIGMHEKNEGRA